MAVMRRETSLRPAACGIQSWQRPGLSSAEGTGILGRKTSLMRRSREVPLTLLASLALTMVACRNTRRDCVDAQNRLLPDSACQAGRSGGVPAGHYMYGGSSGGHVGDRVVGGSVSRGGFGGIGASEAGGGE